MKNTDIPKSIKEEVADVVQVILEKVKVTSQDDEDDIFLSSKTNSCNIIDI